MPVTTEQKERTIGDLLSNKAEQYGDSPFVYYDEIVVSYRQMNRRANRVAGYFQSIGITKGDKIIIYLENCPEWLYAWYGLAKLGAVSVLLNTAHKGKILEYQINNSDAKVLITSQKLFKRILPIKQQLIALKEVIVCFDGGDKTISIPFGRSFSDVLIVSPFEQREEIRYDDTISIMYTSGTTGLSKGVVQPHNQYVWCGEQVAKELKLEPNDIFYCWFPLFHIAGGMFYTSTLLTGSSIVMTETLSIGRFWSDIKRYQATVTGGFASMMELLYKQPQTPEDSQNSLRHMLVGHPPESIRKDFEKRFNLTLTDDYGMTELEPISYSLEGELDIKPGSCGRPVKDIAVKIVDENDNDLGPNITGEIVAKPLKPYIMMKEYYKMPEATEETWANGWFHTGDYGFLDEDGYLYFVDRKKDCIRRKGENISSVELENIINSHPSILESVAVGIPSGHGEEEVKIVVRLKPGEQLSYEDLFNFCIENMAFFMIPRYVEFIDQFLKNKASKILKKKLKYVDERTWDRVKEGFKIKR